MEAGVLRRARELAEAEARQEPRALWIVRKRRVRKAAYASAARRTLQGPAFGVACRVEDARGRVLLVRPPLRRGRRPRWVTPGGGGRKGETPREAVRREVREETGGALRELTLWKVYDEELQAPDGRRLSWVFLQYCARWKGGVPRPRDRGEIAEARWFHRLPANMDWREDWLRKRPGGEPRRAQPRTRGVRSRQ